MAMTMTASLTDVSKRAGVSLATASRAFSEPDRLAPATRAKVLAAAAELGYQSAASSQRTLVVVVPDISNAVFGALVKAIQDRAWPGRHRVILCDSNEEPAREREQIRLAQGHDGLILCSPRLAPEELAALSRGVPTVVINDEIPGLPAVLMDGRNGIVQAVAHLAALGHRRLAFVPGPAQAWANRQRLTAVSAAAGECEVELVVVGNQAASLHGGAAAAAPVAISGATAVIAYNDLVALGLEAGLRGLGRQCPGDISIVGIDDLDVAAASNPGLTTIHVAIGRGGLAAVDLLLDLIAGRPISTEPFSLESQLIVRDSTGPAQTR